MSPFFLSRCYLFFSKIWPENPENKNETLQILNCLGDKFSGCDFQNEALITHYEKKPNRNHAKCFLF